MSRQIVVFVGTDFHPFQRAVDWADAWQSRNVADRVYVQYGTSIAPREAAGSALIPAQEVGTTLVGADVVVCHGGPGTIAQVRAANHRPIVFPRDPAYGEHVDRHQLLFARWCADRNLIDLVSTREELDHALEELPASGTRAAQDINDEVARTVARFTELVVAEAPVRRRLLRLRAVLFGRKDLIEY